VTEYFFAQLRHVFLAGEGCAVTDRAYSSDSFWFNWDFKCELRRWLFCDVISTFFLDQLTHWTDRGNKKSANRSLRGLNNYIPKRTTVI
jgi:hypothetical protein